MLLHLLFKYAFRERDIHIDIIPLENIKCSGCDEVVTFNFSAISRCDYFLEIPLYPKKKIYLSACPKCKYKVNIENVSADTRRKFEMQKAIEGTRTPLWLYTGVLLLGACLFIGLLTSGLNNNNKREGYINKPLAGDMYHIRLKDGGFTAVKVIAVMADSIDVSINNHIAIKVEEINRIDIRENYVDTVRLSKNWPKELEEKDELIDVIRY